jgi:nicotinamidase-related amidase
MKRLCYLILFILQMNPLYSQVKDSTALLIIDIQKFYFPGGSVPLENPEVAAENAALLLNYFRKTGNLVVHIGHVSKTGADFFSALEPLPGEKVIMKKEVNAFLHTGLDDFLRDKNIRKLVLCGMQTHMCLEAATRAGHDLGYQCTVAYDACATRNLSFGEKTVKAEDVHYSTLATLKSYATVLSTKEILNPK